MYLTHLSLTNFRNYARLELDLPSHAVIVLGDNAQGKSNLLESIYFLATTRSFRASSDRELINWLALEGESPFTRLVARVQKEHSALRVEIAVKEEGKRPNGTNGALTSAVSKRVKVNNIARRAIDLIGQVNVVMFSPQDIGLVSGSPQLRRRYLDVTISQVDPRYCRTLAHYNKVLMQRNHLLRQVRDKHSSPDQLLFWNQELANAGAYIILQRLETLAVLNDLTFGLHRKLTGSQECLRILSRLSLENASVAESTMTVDDVPTFDRTIRETPGSFSSKPTNRRVSAAVNIVDLLQREMHTATLEAKVVAIAELFLQHLALHQKKEIAYGVSLIGPHRDDLAFLVDDRDMNTYGSRGQQRTVALSLKLAEMEFMRKRTGEEPILLLDDVASELDAHRRSHVIEALRTHQQVIMTTTDIHALEGELQAKPLLLRVENGAVQPL